MERDSWNIRIHSFIKEYFQKKGINPREILEQKYYEMKKNELPELLKEKKSILERVAQIDSIVPQLEVDCATIYSKLDLLCKDYIETGRSIENPSRQDMYWINSRCDKEKISVETFLNHCRELKGGV